MTVTGTVAPPTLPAPTGAAEPGFLTTEFWVALATQLIGLLTVTGVIHPSTETVNGIMGLLALIVPTIAYALSRGIRKSGTPG
jgi:hypothetical protein